MSNPELDELYTTDNREEIEHAIQMGEALERLEQNKDFQTFILKGYLEGKVLASFSLLGVPQMQGKRGNIMEDLVAASNLKYFLQMTRLAYEGAKKPILSDDEEEEIRQAVEEGGVH